MDRNIFSKLGPEQCCACNLGTFGLDEGCSMHARGARARARARVRACVDVDVDVDVDGMLGDVGMLTVPGRAC